jgi:tRNA1Val (adenine37-N6)-methyltransferase
MGNTYFQFKQFTIHQDRTAMKVCTDACLFGAWVASVARQQLPNDIRVLDIGAGTGLLSLMLAQELSEAKLTAIEIDALAAEQATENFQASPWKDRLTLMMGDIQTYRPAIPFSFIISNPPFYEGDLRSPDKQRNLALHDTGLGLNDWWEIVPPLLTNHGHCAILLPAFRENECLILAEAKEFQVLYVARVRQTVNHPEPFRVMLFFGRGSATAASIPETIMIAENGSYSQRFSKLMQPFYLKG